MMANRMMITHSSEQVRYNRTVRVINFLLVMRTGGWLTTTRIAALTNMTVKSARRYAKLPRINKIIDECGIVTYHMNSGWTKYYSQLDYGIKSPMSVVGIAVNSAKIISAISGRQIRIEVIVAQTGLTYKTVLRYILALQLAGVPIEIHNAYNMQYHLPANWVRRHG